MNAEDRELLDLAGRISDGKEIDWDSEERSAPSDEHRRVVQYLRAVGGLADVHRTHHAAPPTADDISGHTTTIFAGAAADDATLDEPTRWGHLQIRAKLGEGAFGAVYRAWDENLQHEVALKLLKPADAGSGRDPEEFLREGRMLARLRHPNVITVHGAETHDDRLGIWMELVDGQTLGQQLRAQGRFGAREAALVGLELCRALAAVHGAGLIHRDVKAQNVMRGDGGRILLMDFGAGVELRDGTGRGKVSGTPLYMAPETMLEFRASAQSDIYSLGVLLYLLVTDTYPVKAGSIAELTEMHRKRESRLLRDARADLPEAFVKTVERALDWDPAGRFATAGEMEHALTATLGATGEPAPTPTPPPAPRQSSRAAILVASAVAVVALLALGWWALEGRAVETTQPESAAAASAAYEVEAGVYRRRPPDGVREELESGARLTLGDELSVNVRGSVPLYVYIFNEDEEGRAFALFPLPGLALENPLPADVTHQLPGVRADGSSIAWGVNTPGGREHLIVLASPSRLVEFEAEMNRLPRPTDQDVAVALPPETMVRMRGVGALVDTIPPEEAPAGGEATGKLHEMARQLTRDTERVEGVWLRELELLNPAP